MEFAVGDHVLLNIFPYKGKMQFGKKGKLSPRYVEPFMIMERIRPMAYRLALPRVFTGLHVFFHVSILIRYHPNPSHIILHQEMQVQ